MNITSQHVGKKFGKNWILRNLNFKIKGGTKFAITGKNGSGKSTLLKLLSGFITPSEGKIFYDDQPIETKNLSNVLIGPYMEIIGEFTLREFLTFHSHFKKASTPIEEMTALSSLPLDKSIVNFSTGMKQRAKLMMAFFFENEIIMMDEPTSNLDTEGYQWWKHQMNQLKNKTVVIASNQKNEISLCSDQFKL